MRSSSLFIIAGMLTVIACSNSDGPVAPWAERPLLAMGGPDYPKPKLVLDNKTPTPFEDAFGNQYLLYDLSVSNSAKYSDELFAPAPSLPPCGSNANSSRTWVTIFDTGGNELNRFCALGSGADLNFISFAIPEGETPPKKVYLTLEDRQTGVTYTSRPVHIP